MRGAGGTATLLLFAAACSSSPGTGGAGGTTGSTQASTTTTGSGGSGGMPPIGGDRPVEVTGPSDAMPGEKLPLIILLHGYGVSGLVEDLYMGLGALAESKRFFFLHPTGTVDKSGSYFWNATDACCDFDGTHVDDSAYIAGLVDQMVASYPVDPKRVYLVGHSNGGFMSYRMACDHADKIAAMVSLAGAMWMDPSKCQPSGPVHVLQIHGTADDEVLYDGAAAGPGPSNMAYPSAETTVEDWVALDHCNATPDTSAAPLDLEEKLPGAETTVKRWEKGCQAGGSAELWSMQGGSHIPVIGTAFRDAVVSYLFAHPKP
jgi:polyhydroxybutyrate depolymerase